ncbi:hypothetical protein [Kaistia sp. MMO-174]|uniref:hypothetical protein n=1 Tax=Kaistia sp. MMO-174 TaxID=3081256 RepID=UPI00301ACFE6
MVAASFCSTPHAIAALTDARERARQGVDTSAAQEEAVAFILDRCGPAQRRRGKQCVDGGTVE